MFALIVDLVSVGRVDGVDQGKVHPDAIDVYDLIACRPRFATWRRFALPSRAFLIRSICCLFLKTLSGRGPGRRVAAAWAARVHLVVWEMSLAF
eukprot:4749872-Pleurochrysis_carterae.AAC.1